MAWNPSTERLPEYLKRLGLTVVDKRAKGGALWIIGNEDLRPLISYLASKGARFWHSKKGGRASKHQPAWFTTSAS
jgi:hypothetical protein